MALVIKTTGLEQYAPGGQARLKLLIIGGPGVGKTRWASYFPKPIYADCEAGLASVADREVPYVGVNSSTDMLDLLTHLKQECRLPQDKRSFDTVIIDTLDAYQRKLKNEWMERNKAESFTGWEAWGFVSQKLQLLLTKLLNLDMNVIVNVHFKDKVTKDDDTGKETHTYGLQMQGDVAETAFNDFDLVGWMGTFWEAQGGERVQKRGITFQPTPERPMLKDRLHVTPKWLEVTFDEADYNNLFERVTERVVDLAPTATVGQIPSADPDADVPSTVIRPETVPSGALPAQPKAELPLAQLDKPSLLALARKEGVSTLPDGTPIKGNSLKAELISAIEHHRSKPAGPALTEAVAAGPAVTVAQVADAVAEVAAEIVTEPAPQPAPAKPPVPKQSTAPDIEKVVDGLLINTSTGEIVPDVPPAPSVEEAINTVTEVLGGQVVAETPTEPESAPAQEKTPAAGEALARRTQAQPSNGSTCQECGTDLATEDRNFVKLAKIKYRLDLCAAHYAAEKAARDAARA